MTKGLVHLISEDQHGGEVEEAFPSGLGTMMSARKLFFVILTALAIPAGAQISSEQSSRLPDQAEPVRGVAMPVPKEIFRSLDQFPNANWRAVQRPEIARWKSHGDQAQIATLLGVVLAEGFIAMEAQDSAEVKDIGNTVLILARGLGVEEQALRRSRSIMELADKNDWPAARKEWDGVLSDLESGMVRLKSEHLSQLISLGGWLRGSEALSTLVLQEYSTERSELIRQPGLIDYLERQLLGLTGDRRHETMTASMLKGIRRIRALIKNDNGPLPEKAIREIRGICQELVRLSSRRP